MPKLNTRDHKLTQIKTTGKRLRKQIIAADSETESEFKSSSSAASESSEYKEIPNESETKTHQARNKPNILPKTKKPTKKEMTKDKAVGDLFTLTQIKERYLKG